MDGAKDRARTDAKRSLGMGHLRGVTDALIRGDEGDRRVLDALPAPVYVADAAGRITYFNEAAADLWGRRPELGRAQWCGSWKLYWPDGTPLPHDQSPM